MCMTYRETSSYTSRRGATGHKRDLGSRGFSGISQQALGEKKGPAGNQTLGKTIKQAFGWGENQEEVIPR